MYCLVDKCHVYFDKTIIVLQLHLLLLYDWQ